MINFGKLNWWLTCYLEIHQCELSQKRLNSYKVLKHIYAHLVWFREKLYSYFTIIRFHFNNEPLFSTGLYISLGDSGKSWRHATILLEIVTMTLRYHEKSRNRNQETFNTDLFTTFWKFWSGRLEFWENQISMFLV